MPAPDNTPQVNAFIEHKIAIDALIERLQEASSDHFDTHPDGLNWTDVAEIARIREKLQEVNDCVFQEGEYAL